MGATFAARDEEGRRVAVKVVGNLEGDAQQRFSVECQILASLDHPAIVRYLSHGNLPDGHGYLVMELLEGRDLQQVLDDLGEEQPSHPVTQVLLGDADPRRPGADAGYRNRILRLAATVAEALHHAHEQGILHRDLKPANIVLQPDLSPRLVDFGLGLDLFQGLPFTRSSAMVGTVVYMAPEQLRGNQNAVDRRTDVFALGLVLFRCLCGRDLHASFEAAMESAHGTSQIRMRDLRALPGDLQAVLYRCLETKPRRRYPTAEALARDLDALIEGRPVQARLPSPVSRIMHTRRGRALAWTSVVLAMLIGSILWLSRPQYLLTIDALYDLVPGDLYLDGEKTDFSMPVRDIPIAAGEHQVEYRVQQLGAGAPARALPIRKTFRVDHPITRVTLMNVPNGWPVDTSFTDLPREESAFLQVLSATGAELFFNGRPIAKGARWIQVPPGTHRIAARSDTGHYEEQEIVLSPATLHPTMLLAPVLESVPGRYRRTLGNVLAPFPEDLELHLENGAVAFLNDFQDYGPQDLTTVSSQMISGKSISSHCYVTSVLPGEETMATVRISFPETMCSVVFWFSGSVKGEGPVLRVEYRIEGSGWVPTPSEIVGPIEVRSVPAEGTAFLELRGRMLVPQVPGPYVPLHFLATYVDTDQEVQSPCFAVVADPDPDVARMPR